MSDAGPTSTGGSVGQAGIQQVYAGAGHHRYKTSDGRKVTVLNSNAGKLEVKYDKQRKGEHVSESTVHQRAQHEGWMDLFNDRRKPQENGTQSQPGLTSL